MTHSTPRTLFHGIGAAAITLLTFGFGPAAGLTATTMPMTEVLAGPVEGAPQGTLDMASFAMTMELHHAEPASDGAPVDAESGEDDTNEEAMPEVVATPETPQLASTAPRPQPKASTPVPAAETEAKSAFELARTGEQPTQRPKGKRCKVDETNPKIDRIRKGTFSVDRSLITYYIGHLGELNRLGWSSKHKGPDGKSVGMRIGGVRCGNDLHLAGIRSGDVVHRVNGHDVRSIPQAIMLYRKLRKDKVIRVELTRRGKPLMMTYRLS